MQTVANLEKMSVVIVCKLLLVFMNRFFNAHTGIKMIPFFVVNLYKYKRVERQTRATDFRSR